MSFCKILDKLMTNNGVSNYQLSKETGISDSLIGYWRSGKRKPTMDNLIILSEYFCVSIDFLVKGKETDASILLDSCNNSHLSEDETELISTYKRLDRRGQHRIHTIIYEELDRIASSKETVSKNTI